MHRQQHRFALVAEQLAVGQRAGRDHAHHLALDRAFRGGRVADLFADRDRLAEPDQARGILDRTKGTPAITTGCRPTGRAASA